MIMSKKLVIFFLAGFLVLTGSLGAYAQQGKTLTQISTIDALLGGVYGGKRSMQQLEQYGDTGLGTFDALDGEMVMVDGTAYRISVDGTVQVPALTETTPFAAVTFFQADREKALPRGIDMPEMYVQQTHSQERTQAEETIPAAHRGSQKSADLRI
jgi:acetolactate decarboxylase